MISTSIYREEKLMVANLMFCFPQRPQNHNRLTWSPSEPVKDTDTPDVDERAGQQKTY